MARKIVQRTAEDLRAEILAPVLEERARIESGRAEAQAVVTAAGEKYEAEYAVWKVTADECERFYRPAPPRPVPDDTSQSSGILHMSVLARQACAEWERRLLAEQRGIIETAYREEFPRLQERTKATPLGDTATILAEWEGWRRLVHECRSAAERDGGRFPHDPPSGRMRSTLTTVDLIDVVDGADILEPFPTATDWIKDLGWNRMNPSPDGPTGLTLAEARLEAHRRLHGGRPGW